MDSYTFISVLSIGVLIFLLLGYRAYIKEKANKLSRQEKIVDINFFGRKMKIVPIDIYSTKSILRIVIVALIMIFVFIVSLLFLEHSLLLK